MKEKTLLDIQIELMRDKLWKFAQTPAFDSGVRWVEGEFYLKGLEKAKRLVNKQAKIEREK